MKFRFTDLIQAVVGLVASFLLWVAIALAIAQLLQSRAGRIIGLIGCWLAGCWLSKYWLLGEYGVNPESTGRQAIAWAFSIGFIVLYGLQIVVLDPDKPTSCGGSTASRWPWSRPWLPLAHIDAYWGLLFFAAIIGCCQHFAWADFTASWPFNVSDLMKHYANTPL